MPSSKSPTSAPVAEKSLPEYRRPPVNETALSIQFAPLDNFGIPHYGLYWSKIRSEFGKYQIHTPLPSITEQFGDAQVGQGVGFQLLLQPDVRSWFLDNSGTRLVQLQRDRFIHNWRQVKGDEEYPRYPAVKNTLVNEWKRFREFLTSEKLGPPQVNQCEVIYVNHLEYTDGWAGYGEFNKAIANWSRPTSGGFLPAPEKVNLEAHYVLPNQSGRLHISVLPVIRGRDLKEVLQISLTARGAPKSSSDDDVFSWFDLGREWVVKGFTDFTTPDMHKLWGRSK